MKQIHKLSDENTVVMWCENPYWQYFCGMQFFTHERLAAQVQWHTFASELAKMGLN
ncbi:transposase [Pseudoalteromonas piscicida]|uniref:transposase n=1 Tax=Pseudoalteromonas piscicida TaxID=43662 RepID=UPI001D0A0E6C|nr:transposase [Pseudoalteromonas piscicida]